MIRAIHEIRRPIQIVRNRQTSQLGLILVEEQGTVDSPARVAPYELVGSLPALYPEWLGDRSFGEAHGVRFPYVAGAMANGIATTRLVTEMGRAGMLGFFGAAGLMPDRVDKAIDELQTTLGDQFAWGSNLIYSPNESSLESAVADIYVRRGVRKVSASAYMALTPSIVRYSATGLRERPDGRIERQNAVFAKISRPETARPFMCPAPKEILDALVRDGLLSAEEARLASRVPIAEDFTVEADSGGHTDNQVLTAVFPIIAQMRDELVLEYGYERPIRIGAAGGIGTPAAVAGAFALGAAYVLTGSVNQAAVESGLSEAGRGLLAQADLNDVIMAPASDMFEQGVKLQVLKRGTMFGVRALQLYEIYTSYESLEELPAPVKERLERRVLSASVEEIWKQTEEFFNGRDPGEVERAYRDPKHKMALVFRWYLGLSSNWAIGGDPQRKLDYQIWCGPAMGAFNEWVRGSHLEAPEDRGVVQIAYNLLEGAAVITRAQQLRVFGVPVPPTAFHFRPRPLVAS
jgi:trans-AT polyketide synthase/acyltransferase/oxidoreductase domain-containing protein